jgi:peroxiredoxin
MPAEVGQPAPEFTAPSHLGDNVALSQFKGQKYVVLAFFPAAFTSG